MTDRNANRPGYKKTKVGWIPEEWEVKRLDSISKVIMGQSPKSEFYNEEKEGLPLIQGMSDIKDGKTQPRYWTTQITKECQLDDIILSVRAPVGSIARSNHHGCIGRGVCAIRSKKSSEFTFQLLQFMEPFWARCAQGSTFEAVVSKDVKLFPVPNPSHAEQKRIAEILSTWDRAIEQTQKLIDAKRRLKKGLMQQLLTGRMRFPGFGPAVEKAGELPEGWEEKRLHYLVKLNYGKSPKDILDDKGNIPVVGTSEEIRKGNKSLTKQDTIIMGRKGSIDNISYFDKPVWTIDTAFYTTDYDGVQPKFLFYSLVSTHLEKYNESTGVPSLSISTLNKIRLYIPNVIEQQRIVDLITIVDKGIVNLKNHITLSQLQKSALMNKLLSGEVRV